MNSYLNSNAIIWKSEYNISNFKIDKEHQKLFTIAREAMNVSKLKDDAEVKTKLKEIISKLFDYVKTHFSNEQKYMEEIDYPELENHKILHKNMLIMLTTLISELNKLELEDIEKSLFNFIEEYFIRHIVLEDKKIQLWNTSLEDLKKNFGWKEIYSVGNVEIDREHKKLFDIAQDAFMQVEEKQRNAKIKEVLTELYTYMKTHFKHEEKFMKEITYPLIEEHKVLHHNIIEKINTFVKQLPTMDESFFEKELAKIIDIALVHHIIQEDRKIIAWSKSNLQK
ncbi:MAG: bacteriohemerythrin [Aliarcobacter sp.]|nr:bacteriohemerythrin [Aliarcobacter sp.]